ncbi:MAG: hypothetical protein WBB73_16950 [Candidatus Aminicenantaceae bacterium]
MKNIFLICLVLAVTCSPILSQDSGRILPEDLIYRGVFRLPNTVGPSLVDTWEWGGYAMAYFADGDPYGPEDGFPGSIFATGHAWSHLVAEISVPIPVISTSQTLGELNAAAQLQTFTDILNVSNLEIPRTGLAWLPAQGAQTSGKLYFCWGYHMQEAPADLTHGWCETDLSDPQVQGGWYLEGWPVHVQNMSTNNYLCAIPSGWADLYTPGLNLATGRFRDGGWSGQGPALFAIGPWNQGNPPPPGSALPNTPLILYTSTYAAAKETHSMNDYHHSDEWSGAAWLTAGEKSALIFVGTKGKGDCWYGNEDGPCLNCENRGWWSDEFGSQILFFDVQDLAEVATGIQQPWEPQPYAVLEIDEYLFHITSNQQKYHLGAACFDAQQGFLYVFEPHADGEKPVVHVWQIPTEQGEKEPDSQKKKASARR